MLNPTDCPSDTEDAETTASLEVRALQKMIAARCVQIERLVEESAEAGALESRERDFQYQAFVDRCARARAQLMNDRADEPPEMRAARFEKTLHGLECSWSYFGPEPDDTTTDCADNQRWAICVK